MTWYTETLGAVIGVILGMTMGAWRPSFLRRRHAAPSLVLGSSRAALVMGSPLGTAVPFLAAPHAEPNAVPVVLAPAEGEGPSPAEQQPAAPDGSTIPGKHGALPSDHEEAARAVQCLPVAKPDALLSREGPHSVELLEGLFTYQVPIPRLEEFQNIKISVLVPTRGRPELLRASLASLMDLAVDPESVQVVLRSDRDDRSMAGFRFPGCPHLKLLCGEQMRGYASLHYFYTECAVHSSGSVLVLWNDDAKMLTPGWDRELWRETAERRERSQHGFWSLSNNHWPYAFPVITRSICERLGAFARISYNDAYLFELARACGIEQRVLQSIQVRHDMLPNATGDGRSLSLYKTGYFDDLVAADARALTR